MKQTTIKPHSDISGSCVIVNFDDLLNVAKIAAAKSRNEINHCMNDIQAGIEEGYQTGNYLHAEFPVQFLESEVQNYKTSIRVLHELSALVEDNNHRETLYIYNISQQCETLVHADKQEG